MSNAPLKDSFDAHFEWIQVLWQNFGIFISPMFLRLVRLFTDCHLEKNVRLKIYVNSIETYVTPVITIYLIVITLMEQHWSGGNASRWRSRPGLQSRTVP